MKIFSLIFLLALAADASAKTEILPFKIPASRQSCAKQLEPATNAQVIAFPTRLPEFQDSESFLKEMHQSSEHYTYFFYSAAHENPFATYNRKWTAVPHLSESGDLYIVAAVPQRESIPVDPSPMSMFTLRTHFNLRTFTKLRLPKIFPLLSKLILHTRLLEEQITGGSLPPVRLDHSTLYARQSTGIRLEQFINSWETVSPHEEKIKWLMKQFVRQNLSMVGDETDCQKFAEALLVDVRETYRNTAFLSEMLLSVLFEAI